MTWREEVAGGIRTTRIPPGDYNLPQIVDELNVSLRKTAALFSDTTVLQVEPTTNPSEIGNKLRITSSGPFTILGEESTIRTTLGMGDPVSVSDTYSIVPGYTVNYPNGASGVFLSKPNDVGDILPAFVGPIPSGDSTAYEGVYDTRVISQYFTSAFTGTPTSISAYVTNVGTPPPPAGHAINIVMFSADDEVMASGMMTIPSVTDDYTPVVAQIEAYANLKIGEQYRIDIETYTPMTEDSHVAIWYAKSNLPPVPGAYITVDGNPVHEGYYFCIDVAVGARGNEIIPSGIVNLRGSRYVKIRCNEIEQMISRDRVGEPTTAGVALINIIGYGYQNARTEFAHYPTRKFHPIGKLQKLTFRFERPDGTLYNTNGVDNSLL